MHVYGKKGRDMGLAVLEFIDHHEKNSGNNIASNLFETGAAIKRKAYDQALGYLQ